MSLLTRWAVYEYMKMRFRSTGCAPDRNELLNEFAGIDPEELNEGIEEFNALMGNQHAGAGRVG
ncbi:hypothetical protein BVG16_16460 [Paenibacillus selenitireducens]|uniref:Uncharacterized protein n=1 Tax=Paenibacillus selenitireducens TaxID=1324314 RepID=A0A1T2XAC6_9BACL|nr:hypothetical protein [Paenibacillus selenitireducens]OPA76762.1 hypothetical protein BVG16_16460 [Paenibacillus selenitireducens]